MSRDVLPFDLIIFDCDGTLVDSERLANEVLVEHAADYGITLSIDDAVRRFRGIRMAECVAQLEALRGERLPDSFVPALRARTSAAFVERLRPVDGAAELLRTLTSTVCVASSGPREKTELSLSVTGLLPFFAGRIFSSYEVGVWKPDPGLFLHAARELGVPPGRCAVVEDSLRGMQAGLAAGMHVFALQTPPANEDAPPEVCVVGSLGELKRLLGATGRGEIES